jgi:16S rRNA (uracil1498-N3)-methyltransferase
MKQFLISQDFSGSELLRIEGKDYHYLHHVLRLRRGDTLLGRCPNGRLYRLRIDSEENGALMLRGEAGVEGEFSQENGFKVCRFTLCQCLPKGQKMDLIIRQATELGIHGIMPMISEYTETRLDGKESRRIERWRRIVREAAQQCGIRILPQIMPCVSLQRFTPLAEDHLGIVFHPFAEREERRGADLHHLLSSAPTNILLFIGPEGGFSPKELERFRMLGYHSVCLGDTVLRVETAALSALAAVKMILREKKYWTVE